MQNFDRNARTINKKFMEYFFPTVLTAMANNIALIVDSIIVGNLLGSESLAAVNLLSPVVQLCFSLTLLFGLGASTVIATAKGAAKTQEANQVFTIAAAALCVLSVLLMAGQLIFLEPILHVLSPSPELRALVKQYYLPFILGTPFSLLMTGASHLVRTDGRPKLASNAVIIANAVNLCMDIVYISVFKIGIAGASLATVTGNAVGLLLLLTHFRSKANTLHPEISVFRNGGQMAKQLSSFLGVGFSGALGALLITVRLAFLNTYVQQIDGAGSSGLVALSLNSSCQVLISTFITGASQTMIPIIGVMMGQKDYEGVRMTLKKTWKVLLAANAAILLLLELFPEAAAGVFGVTAAEDLAVVVPSIRITTLSFVGLSASFMMLYYFMATRKKALSTMVSVVNGVVLIIPLSAVFGELFGLNGLWWAFVAAQAGTLAVILIVSVLQKKNSKGRYQDLYLLEQVPQSEVASLSFTSENSDAVKAAEYIQQFMKRCGVSEQTSAKTALAVEEMAVGTTAKKGAADLDIRISINEQEIILSIRDNGIPCNPLETKPELWQNLDVSGMGVVKALVKKMEYVNVLGFNQTILILENR